MCSLARATRWDAAVLPQRRGLGVPLHPYTGSNAMSHSHRSGRAATTRAPTFCRAASSGAEGESYQGAYGRWTVEPEDVAEVYGYRAGLTVAAAGTAVATLAAFFPNSPELQGLLNPVCLVGGLGLGASLFLIHIYIDVMKRALQAMWAAGMLGFAYLAATQTVPVADYVAGHPGAMWLVGPAFAALTGIAFKEGFCYNKAEAGGLFGVVPLLMGGHLLGVWSQDVERGMAASMAVLFVIFAARKYTQPVKDDLGDKSVFTFLSLSPEEQDRLLAERNGRGRGASELDD